jgi:uridylate kinase
MSLRYRRLMIKLSGEALSGPDANGVAVPITIPSAARVVEEIAAGLDAGLRIALVIGGGNIFRGGKAVGIDRTTADGIGMLATVLNALALRGALEAVGLRAEVFSALPMPPVARGFDARAARAALDEGAVVICAAGTGNPFFSTDTGAVLRALELGCDAMVKSTQVDGIYSADPKKDPTAVRYDRITYDEVLEKRLAVMDAAAIALARDNGLAVVVMREEPGNLLKFLRGEALVTEVVPSKKAG